MNLIVESLAKSIGFDKLISATFRTDLIPIPVLLEFSLVLDDELEAAIIDGAKILVGGDLHSLTIVKVSYLRQQVIKDGKLIKAAACLAVLTGCEALMQPTAKAIILDQCSMATAYRASGCKVAFASDIPVIEFIALYGSFATHEIAKNCLEEAAVICYQDKKLHALRLRELLAKKPKALIDPSEIQWVTNTSAEQSQIHELVSLNSDGSTIESADTQRPLNASYYPKSDARRLKNMQTVLLTRGVLTRQLSFDLNAGDLLKVGDKTLVILTAAHRFDSGAMGGQSMAVTKLWLAEINK